MKVRFFGIGSASPHLERHPSSCLVEIENEYILIDCGEGTQYRLLQNKIKWNKIRTICISHLHGDHYFGLIGLLSSYNLNQRKEPLKIFGPKGLKEILELQFKASGTIINFSLDIEVVDTNKAITFYEHSHFKITTLPLIHRVPCGGFLIETMPTSRKIRAEKLPENFPIPYFKKLQAGEDIVDDLTGKKYLNKDYTTKGLPVKKFAYCSDTAYNVTLIPILIGVDVIYHEATFLEELKARAAKTQHSTAIEAATIAKECGAGKLLIGHFSSRYNELTPFEVEAKTVFDNSEVVVQDRIYSV